MEVADSENRSEDAEIEAKVRELDELMVDINPAIFKMYEGPPMKFYFRLGNEKLKDKYEEVAIAGGGDFVESFLKIDSKTAVMLEDSDKALLYTVPSFKLSYIKDCIVSNSLLDIADYLHNGFFKKSPFYMNVLFFGREKFKISPIVEESSQTDGDEEDSDSERQANKNTRAPFTHREKVDILKFILSRKNQSGLHGDPLWRKMERKKICPRRTWQSMKNHFRRTLLKELYKFEFLTEDDKSYLRGGLL